MFFIFEVDPRGRGVPLLPWWSHFPWHLQQLPEERCDKPLQPLSSAGSQMWLWGAGRIGRSQRGELTQFSNSQVPVWRGAGQCRLQMGVVSFLKVLRCLLSSISYLSVTGLEISWPPRLPYTPKITDFHQSRKDVSALSCFILKGNKGKSGLPSFSYIFPLSSQAECVTSQVQLSVPKWYYSGSGFQATMWFLGSQHKVNLISIDHLHNILEGICLFSSGRDFIFSSPHLITVSLFWSYKCTNWPHTRTRLWVFMV